MRFRMGQWLVDPQLDEISRTDGIIKLEPRMMRLLARLAENPGEVVSTEQLLDSVWAGVVVGPASVYQAISQLRKLLGDTDPTPTYIATVSRKGYRLIAPIEQINDMARQQTPRDQPPRWPVGPWVLAAVAVAAVAVMAILLLRSPAREAATTAPVSDASRLNTDAATRTLAVMPFTSGASDTGDANFANGFTLLIRDRLASAPDLKVIGHKSATRVSARKLGTTEIGLTLGARYLLGAELSRNGGEVRIDAALSDSLSGSQVWSRSYSHRLGEISTLREEVTQDVATALRATLTRNANPPAIDFDLYSKYAEGQRLLATDRFDDLEQARLLFAAALAIDPKFAPAHLGIGQMVVQKARFSWPLIPRDYKRAKSWFDRAVELDPNLGPAWYGRALCIATDVAAAKEMFSRAQALSPSDSTGASYYSEFLQMSGQDEDAVRMIDAAREIDPLSPPLLAQKAQLLKSDMTRYMSLMQQAVDIDPNYLPGLIPLAQLRYVSGQFAEAIRLSEHAFAIKPQSSPLFPALANLYLDVGDPGAAGDFVAITRDTAYGPLLIAQYERKPAGALLIARHCKPEYCGFWNFPAFPAAVRDAAIASRDFNGAIRELESVYKIKGSGELANMNLEVAIVYAHTLMLGGKTQEGRSVAKKCLDGINEAASHVGSSEGLKLSRAAVYALLGDEAGAMNEIEAAQKANLFTDWWYTMERDPIFETLQGNPRFKILAANARRHSDEQRALVDAMRKRGEIPLRPAPAAKLAGVGVSN